MNWRKRGQQRSGHYVFAGDDMFHRHSGGRSEAKGPKPGVGVLHILVSAHAAAFALSAVTSKRGVGLVIQSMGLDTRGNGSNPTTRLQLTILAAVAQFEREVMLERQRDGIAAAKAKGLYKGRKPTARVKSDEIRILAADGRSKEMIAQQLGISRRSVFRILASREVTG